MCATSLTQQYLKECFDYDPETGVLKWAVRPRHHFKSLSGMRRQHKHKAGVICGATPNAKGYCYLSIMDKTYITHSIIYTILHGSIPTGKKIDHMNGVRGDNRAANLRLVDAHENSANMVAKRNRFGVRGVRFIKGRWHAIINHRRKCLFLGSYGTKGMAALAHAKASVRYNGMHSYFLRKHHARIVA